jgi:Holliday junction DNA helicase RuvA
LYGFFDLAEKEMFLYLISVSGIGASTARVMLSYMKPDELARAIINSDVRTLEGIKGIGKKRRNGWFWNSGTNWRNSLWN